MCIRDRLKAGEVISRVEAPRGELFYYIRSTGGESPDRIKVRTPTPVSYTHLRAHETVLDLVCRLLLEKKKKQTSNTTSYAKRTT